MYDADLDPYLYFKTENLFISSKNMIYISFAIYKVTMILFSPRHIKNSVFLKYFDKKKTTL